MMMPFSVVRTLITSLVSWALLGGGLYLAYRAYQDWVPVDQRFQAVSVPERLADERAPNSVDESDLQAVVIRKDHSEWKPWAALAGAFVCLGLTVGGRLPVRWLFSTKEWNAESGVKASSELVVDRPDGSKLHVEVFENVDKPTLLLTHGWSLDSSAWTYLIRELSAHYRLVLWDHAGLGKSKQTWQQLDHSALLGAKAWPSVVARGNFGMMHFDEERTLPKIHAPVLVVSGDQDILTLQSASERMEALLPRATFFGDGGNHLGHWEHSPRVNESILGFAAQVFEKSSGSDAGASSPRKSAS